MNLQTIKNQVQSQWTSCQRLLEPVLFFFSSFPSSSSSSTLILAQPQVFLPHVAHSLPRAYLSIFRVRLRWFPSERLRKSWRENLCSRRSNIDLIDWLLFWLLCRLVRGQFPICVKFLRFWGGDVIWSRLRGVLWIWTNFTAPCRGGFSIANRRIQQ